MKEKLLQARGEDKKDVRGKGSNSRKGLNHARYLCDPETGLYSEEYFKDMLSLERKRTERSKKNFLLMTLDIKNALHRNPEKNEMIGKIAETLLSITREIDIKGWLKYDVAIGVIFAETSAIDRDVIKGKVLGHLSGVMNTSSVKKIEIRFHAFPEDHDDTNGGPPNLDFYHDLLKRNSSRKRNLLLKRGLDIIGGIIGLLVFSPFFAIISLGIKLTSKGPVYFKQERVGQFGKKFTFLKFRSMYVESNPAIHREYIKKYICEQENSAVEKNDGNGKALYKLTNDPRITPIGSFIRKTSLDELPQFINVLRGEMSLVGPRPAIPYELENYEIWHRRRVLEVKPGITGLWQVKGRSRTTFDEMVRLDLRYIMKWSLWLDIKLLFQTVWVVVSGRGAY